VRVGEEFEPNTIQYGPPVTSSVAPTSVAFDGKNYVVAWHFDGNHQFFTQIGRYSPELGRLDDVPLDLYEPGYEPPNAVEVASDGNGSVIAYQLCDVATRVKCHYRIKRLDADGKPVDATGIQLTSGDISTGHLRIVGSQKGYLAVWTEQDVFSYTEPYRLRGAIINARAETPIGKAFEIADTLASTAGCSVKLALAASDGNFLVAWTKPAGVGFQSGFDLASARIAFDGTMMASAEGHGASVLKLGGSSNSRIELASDGEGFFVVFTDFVKGANSSWYETVFGANVTEQGEFASDTALMLGDATHDHDSPTVTFDGSNYLVAFRQRSRDGSDVQTVVTTVNRDGTGSARPRMRLLSADGNQLLLPAQCATGCHAVWARNLSGQTAVAAASVAGSLPINESSSTLVSVAPRDEASLGIACARSSCVEIFDAGYSRWSYGGRQILLNELNNEGRVVAGAPTMLAEYFGPGTYSAAVASDGEGYIVAWWERFDDVTSRIHVVALDGRGHVIPGTERIAKVTDSWPGTLKLASTGEGYLLVHRDNSSGKTVTTGILLDRLGNTVADKTFTVDRGYNNAVMPTALAASKQQYLLVVREDMGYLTIRLDKSGKLLEHAVGSAGVLDSVLPVSRIEPKSVASNGTEFLMVWSDPTMTPATGKSQGVLRIAEDGTRTELARTISPPAAHGTLAWNGNAYLWLWSEQLEQGVLPYTQHVTEFAPASDNAIDKRDSTIERAQSIDTIGKFAMSRSGLIWSYGYQAGIPGVRFAGPNRIRHRFISGLCFGDPKGDNNDNGLCDSTEGLSLPETGVGGSSSVASTIATGGSASGSGGVSSVVVAEGGAASLSSTSGGGGSSSFSPGSAELTGSAKGGKSADSQSRATPLPPSSGSGVHRDDDGCSCTAAGSRSPSLSWVWAIGLAAVAARKRRRRSASARKGPTQSCSTVNPSSRHARA
jgi:MYXO-CTERM domain-containing protein